MSPSLLSTFFIPVLPFIFPLHTFPRSMADPLPPTPSPSFNTPCFHQPYEPTATSGFNVAVITAAMLCALLCALGLNSMLHCVVQCTQRTLTKPVEWAESSRMNSGLKKKDMEALPTSTYAVSDSPPPPSISICAICLVDFLEGDKIRVLSECSHLFHIACIDKWLLSHSFCPTCRYPLKSNSCMPCLEIVTAL